MLYRAFTVSDCRVELRIEEPGAVGARGRRLPAAAGDRSRPPECRQIRIRVQQTIGWVNEATPCTRIVAVAGEPDRVVVERSVVSGAFTRSRAGLEGVFRVGGDGVSPLDGVIGLGLALRCEEHGDLLLHASAVERQGRAWLFLGAGGSGKTTIATELLGGGTPLCFDRALVTTSPDGTIRVHGTPLGGPLGGPSRPRRARIAGVFFIEQAGDHEVVRLSRWDATRRLLEQTSAVSGEVGAAQRMMGMIGRIVERDICFRLRFRRDEGFWSLVQIALSGE